MSAKEFAVTLLTKHLPIGPLRAAYRHYQRAANWLKYRDPDFPRIISIEVSTFCNRRCAYCPNSLTPFPRREMSPETLSTIADRLGELDWSGAVDFIFFNEPLLYSDLEWAVRRIKQSAPHCMPRISTNGDALGYWRVSGLIAAGLVRIYVMRHNPTPPGWHKNIRTLQAEFPGYIQVMDIDQVAQETGLHNFGGRVTVPKLRDWPKLPDGRLRCVVHEHLAQIDIDGNWSLCCVDFDRTMTFGNLKDDGFLQIWHKPGFARMRQELRSGHLRLQSCRRCASGKIDAE